MNKDSEHFFDKSTIIAVILLMIAWFAWDKHMRKKYPTAPKSNFPVQEEESSDSSEIASGKTDFLQREDSFHDKSERLFSFQNNSLSFLLSSKGMGFKRIILNEILDRKEQAIELFSEGSDLPFETRLNVPELKEPIPLNFEIREIQPGHWEGRSISNNLEINKKVRVLQEDFLIDVQVEVKGHLQKNQAISTLFNQSYGFWSEKQDWFSSLFQPPDFLSFFISSFSGSQRIYLSSEEESFLQEEASKPPIPSARTVALGTKYFGQAWRDTSEISPSFHFVFQGGKQWFGIANHFILNTRQKFVVSYQIYIGPKSLPLFQSKHPDLVEWVDFGWFSILARWILRILQVFHTFTGNWGISIILLTLLVRFLLLPLVVSSHRSMETMKKIQPLLQEVRKKFKKDPQRMNQEVLALMKTHRANPIGGCLPMFLQIPVFWALWKALSNSYSLYRSPFVFWIQDLSWRDPYYILPALIGLLMFVQQRISPMMTSKEVARMMQILPVFIALFMINFPSGLTLYVFISSSFGLVQQFFLNSSRIKTSLKSPETVKSVNNKRG